MKHKQTGFTLVEIAIVLVIIGLLLGGVLKGQELINQAKIKNIINDINGVSVAIYGYQDRYKRLPGDDNGAAARWPAGAEGSGITAAVNGNGNGLIAGDFFANSGESSEFWHHLRLAGFIAGDPSSTLQPNNAANGIIGVQDGAGPAATPDLSGLVICLSDLPGKLANAIDAQFDDGLPSTGSVRGYVQTGSIGVNFGGTNPTRTAATATGYVDDTSTLYTVCKRFS